MLVSDYIGGENDEVILELVTTPTFSSATTLPDTDVRSTSTAVTVLLISTDLSWSSILLAVIMGAISIVTVVGNLAVLFSYYIDKNIRQPSNYFIFSLAVSDLVGCFLVLFSIYQLPMI
ncbi:putative muscarinic acetylcholine receptor gar-2 [Toxocara canis]|uniref:Putative muscarinic acetylcholine receptor gar-2 n=2 Tax=Toxocara canis TaxID=6265 RepID=A0A0B2VWA2_TOXCA|nr:putative muscarinic acetylcholine receptor gar-2 [Toxocara canis]VDM42633.1 unnamed protein product [Toxocara canis]